MTVQKIPVRAIVVALDASPHSLSALEAAAEIAALMNAELRGMFIEDVNLVRTAELPFAQAITMSGQFRRLDAEDVQHELGRQAGIARRALQETATRLRLSWSFDIVRGVVSVELLKAASDADVITIGRGGWSCRRSAGFGSTTRALIQASPSSVLLVGRSHKTGGPFAAIYDGSEDAVRTLKFAASLAGRKTSGLVVLLTGAGTQNGAAQQIRTLLGESGASQVTLRNLTPLTARSLREALRVTGAKAVLMPSSIQLNLEDVTRILEELHCPALIVR